MDVEIFGDVFIYEVPNNFLSEVSPAFRAFTEPLRYSFNTFPYSHFIMTKRHRENY